MSAIEAAVEPEDESTQRVLEAALGDIARATSFYDFEHAWIAGLRTASASDGTDGRDRVLAAAGRRLHALGPLQDDVARRRWLDQIADEVQLRGDGHLRTDLAALAAAELRETFALAADDMKALQAWAASGAHLNKFSAQHTRAANRIRDLGRIAESLRGSGLLALCSEDEYELAADLARAMKPPVHLVPTVPESLRLSRDDLIRWAQSDIGDKELPRLVRSLIAETEPSAEWIDMPAGTGVASPGWDGVVQCARGNRFVPVGTSNWELTAKQSNTRAKAASDYAKRLEQSTPDERAETAYVAVGCAPWTQARAFASERSGTGDFGRVSALNVDQLEDWLACAVATTIWMREQIGRPVAGIQLLSNWWKNWLAVTTPPLDEGYVLAGREKTATKFRDRCAQTGGIVTVGGQVHRDEIIAFAAAALGCIGTEGRSIGHVLFVDDHDTAQRLFAGEAMSTPGSRPPGDPALTIVVPSADYARHLPAGSPHRLIVPAPGSPQAAITLDAVDSEVVAERLESAGRELHRAHELAGVARTSLIALRRRLAKEPALHTPEWAKGQIDAPLRRCLMLGGWRGTCNGDREIVERMTGKPYSENTDLLGQIDSADAPLATVDQQWHNVSPADTWLLMRAQIAHEDVDAFAEAARVVLTDADPVHELSTEDALNARMHGAGAKYSQPLRQGIATTLALAGSLPSIAVEGASQVSNMADSVTRTLLRSASSDVTPRTWTAIAEVLPLLAEAAPEAVLEALRACIAESHAFTQTMFTDGHDDWLGFAASSPHVPLLWALETIAWSPQHLHGAVDVLARLAAIDPGCRSSNRPAESLASIMCTWMPHTSACTDERLTAVQMLCRHHESVAWPLMLSMLPNGHAVQTGGPYPRFRDWRPAQPAVSRREHWDTVEEVARLLGDHAGVDADRWCELLSKFSDLPPPARPQVAAALDQLAAGDPTEEFKSAVWPVLREFLASHRDFHDAQWALPEAELEPLDRLLERLRPADPVAVYGHLFSTSLTYIDGVRTVDGREIFEAALQAQQASAVQAVLADADITAVLRLAQGVRLPRWVGMALAICDPTLDADVLASMDGATAPVTEAALGYFGNRFPDLGWDGFDQLITDRQPSPQATADLMRTPPPSEHAWKRVELLGPDVAAEYWSRVTNIDLGWLDDLDQLLDLSRRLRTAGRLDLVGRQLTMSPQDHAAEPAFAEEIVEYLRQRVENSDAVGASSVMDRWELTQLLKLLGRHRVHLGASRVALLEWQYYPLLQYEPGFAAPNLYRELAHDPDLFVQLVEWAFKPVGPLSDQDSSPDEQREQLALHAWRVLHEWPGNHFVPHSAENPDTYSSTTEPGGVVNEAPLWSWIEHARKRLAEIYRADIGDQQIGAALAATPADSNGDWPGRAVRDLLEHLKSSDIESGIATALYNRRGVTTRGITEGGTQERELISNYRAQSRKFREWPRTAAIFADLARSYEREARVVDREAESHRRGLPL